MGIGQGFGQNYQDLYNRASQDMLGNAINYAGNNFQPLLEAAMLDDRRNLDENVSGGTHFHLGHILGVCFIPPVSET